MRKLAAIVIFLFVAISFNAQTKKTQPKLPPPTTTETKAALTASP